MCKTEHHTIIIDLCKAFYHESPSHNGGLSKLRTSMAKLIRATNRVLKKPNTSVVKHLAGITAHI